MLAIPRQESAATPFRLALVPKTGLLQLHFFKHSAAWHALNSSSDVGGQSGEFLPLMPPLLRVLQLAKHFEPDTGGIETVTLNVSEVLLTHNIQADVLCTEVKGSYQEQERGYQVIRCPADLSIGNKRLSRRYVELGRQLEGDYDCAIVHLPNPLAVLAALGWEKPVILLWHADIPQALVRWATTPMDRLLLRKACVVIGPTAIHLDGSHLADAIKRRAIIPYPFDRTRALIATGTSAFAGKLREFRQGRALSISVGRLVSYKGFDVLVQAARDFGDQLCALIVGSGPLGPELRARVKAAGVGDRVMLAGALSAGELADALAQARMGCMPSTTAAEMYGLSQIESMAAGLPMVSTDIPRSGVPFINRHNETGLVVEPGNPRALASAMLSLVNDAALQRRLSKGALRSIATEHDVRVVGERYAHLIREATGQT